MKCIFCNTELPDGSQVCTNCGKKPDIVPDVTLLEDDYLKAILEKQEQKQEQQKEKKTQNDKKANSTRIVVIIVGSAVALCLLAILLFMIWNKSQQNSFDYQLRKANQALQKGKHSAALEHYTKAYELDPTQTQVALAAARIYMEDKSYNNALYIYLDLVNQEKATEEVYRNLITIYEAQGNQDAIVDLCDGIEDAGILMIFSEYIVTPPTCNYKSGKYEEYLTIEISGAKDSKVYYTLDDTDPVLSGKLYKGPISFEDMGDYKIRAVGLNEKGIYSKESVWEYTIDVPAPSIPAVSPDGGDYTTETMVTVTVPEGCVAYYTWDGSDPSVASEKYVGPFPMPEGNNVLSVIIIDEKTELASDIYRKYFTYYPEEE